MLAIHYFKEGTPFSLPHPRKTSNWIKQVIIEEGGEIESLNFIFCSDEYLHGVNVEYLKHNTFTDIITFDLSADGERPEGEIYISIQRVIENAKHWSAAFDHELHRVIIHGVLHLLGYSDKTARQKALMRKKEDSYLSLRK